MSVRPFPCERGPRRLDRRSILRGAGLLAATTAASLHKAAWARAPDPVDGEEAHAIEAPPAFELRTMRWSSTPMAGWPSTAIVGIPRDLAPGDRLPLVVLLPGGHHNMQRHDQGCWGWWSEYRLGELDEALRRGAVDDTDFRRMARPRDLELFNAALASTPYRGAVYVTPWVVGRQKVLAPHGAMVTPFLRDLVERARAELPVLPLREATGLGGMSTGGMWTLYSGPALADLFGTLIATQPFTEELLRELRAALRGQTAPQRLRMVTSDHDHQRDPTYELAAALRADGIEHELFEYHGGHSALFAAGPGGLDALLHFDRALRGERFDGTKPLPPHDGLAIDLGFDHRPRPQAAPRLFADPRPWSPALPIAAIGAATAGAAVALRRRDR